MNRYGQRQAVPVNHFQLNTNMEKINPEVVKEIKAVKEKIVKENQIVKK
jgi:hypothetical protein